VRTNIPRLIYDSDCNFCRYWIAQWQHVTADCVEYRPFQEVTSQFPDISQEQFETAVQFIDLNGEVFSGAEAVFRTLTYAPHRWWAVWLWMYQRIPGFAATTEWIYRFVANHRTGFSTMTRWFWGLHTERASYFLSRWLFLRSLGVIYLIAFLSLWVQIDGLVGNNGILPSTAYLEAIREQIGPQRYRLFPTLCWLNPSDSFAHFLCGGGILLSIVLIIGILPIPTLISLWGFYLSLTTIGQDFLSFQWDVLLLEIGFLAIFFAPMQILPRFSQESPPSPTILWLLRWLLFRVMFASGVVKLASDEVWRNLTALNYHYETQPLPTWLGWYAHQLPEWFQKVSVVGMFGIELIVPFLLFAPRRLRFCAGGALVALQFLIIATGNYCFFNLLTIILCILLFDDLFLRRAKLASPKPAAKQVSRFKGFITTQKLLIGALTALVLLVSGIRMTGLFLRGGDLPSFAQHVVRWVGPFRIINGYGLFADMTESRPEIIVEGSNDGKAWHEYSFKWKPGDVKHPPRWVAPHQPRLDWQMWFAALRRNYQNTPWFINFMVQLLRGSPAVLGLLERNPFPDAPPRYVRAVLYDYRFTNPATKRAEGTWWRRERIGLYCPAISLRNE